MNELKLPEPDTHCLDDEGGRPIDVWSYSPELVREILAQQSARHAEELAAYELTVSNLREQRGYPTKTQVLAITTAYEQGVGKGHQAHQRNTEIENPYCESWGCREAWGFGYAEGKEQSGRTALAPEPERKPMKAADIVALHKSIEPEATAISELMLRTIRAVESFHGIKEKP